MKQLEGCSTLSEDLVYLNLQMYRIALIVILFSSQTMAGSWLNLHEQTNPMKISQDLQSLATLTAVPAGNMLSQFGQISYHRAAVFTPSNSTTQINHLSFALQPLPEWVFTTQLWNLGAEYPVWGYGLGANYIWLMEHRTQWSTEIQLSRIAGQNTFSQKNLSLTQHYLRAKHSWEWGVGATYNLEHTLTYDVPGMVNRDRNYWILSGNLAKTLFSMFQFDVCLSFGKTGPAGRAGVNWGIGN